MFNNFKKFSFPSIEKRWTKDKQTDGQKGKKIKRKKTRKKGKNKKKPVKMRSPNQGLGSIPASKKWGSGCDPRVHNMQLRDCSLKILGPIPDQPLTNSGIDPRSCKRSEILFKSLLYWLAEKYSLHVENKSKDF